MTRLLSALLIAFLSASCGKSQAPENPVIGVITTIEGDRMELEWGDSQTTEFRIADQSVTRQHLVDHMRMQWPVKVSYEGSGDSLRAMRIDDATPAPAATSPASGY